MYFEAIIYPHLVILKISKKEVNVLINKKQEKWCTYSTLYVRIKKYMQRQQYSIRADRTIQTDIHMKMMRQPMFLHLLL